jgi:aldehyde dehydrogenase (NAD(P)+)
MAPTLQITLPNGVKYDQPTGLFIDNEFVPASGDDFAVVDPTYVLPASPGY